MFSGEIALGNIDYHYYYGKSWFIDCALSTYFVYINCSIIMYIGLLRKDGNTKLSDIFKTFSCNEEHIE